MTEPFTIRPATIRDVPLINDAISEWLGRRIPREKSLIKAIKQKQILVAECERRLIGFISFVFYEDVIDGGLVSFITSLYVLPTHRHKGVGTKILQGAISRMLKRGVVSIKVATIYPEAKLFYERNNFKQVMGREGMGEVFLERGVNKSSRLRHPSNQHDVKKRPA